MKDLGVRLRALVGNAFVCWAVCLGLLSSAHSQTLPITNFGRTPGGFNVSAAGQATYQIPIWVPPGARGLQPQLTLSYSSQGGDGLIGTGWSLSGLSQIARCQRTHEQDSYRQAVLLTMADAFCIDGRRLRLTSGTYGGANSTYQTELADFSLVIANGTSGSGPTWFEVRARNGLIYEYGNSTASRAVLPGTTTPYLWALNKVRDRNGNNMAITYTQGGGTLAPSLIEYTQTPALGSSYPYAVTFTYGTRDPNDQTNGYIAGAAYTIGSQLLRVDVKRGGASGTLTRRYRLAYADSPTTQRSRLTSVQECSGTTGSECLTPTQFGYQDGVRGVADPTAIGGQLPVGGSIFQPRLVDLNGDALTDILYFKQVAGGGRQWFVRFANPGGGFGADVDTGAVSDTLLVDDFVGEGRLGLLGNVSGVWHLYRWNGTRFYTTSTGLAIASGALVGALGTFASVDMNGDGLPEILWAEVKSGVTSVYTRVNTSVGGVPSFSTTATAAYPVNNSSAAGFYGIAGNYSVASYGAGRSDFNGDGREDALLFEWTGSGTTVTTRSLIAQGMTFASGFVTITTPYANPWRPLPVNFNNDSCTDLAGATELYISPCNGSAGQQITYSVSGASAILDWDGDGRADVLGKSEGLWYVQLSAGSALAPSFAASVTVSANSVLFATEHNGDGLQDLVAIDAATGDIRYGVHNGVDTPPDLMTSITDGFGNVTQPTYKSITRGNYQRTYVGMMPVTWPDREFFNPYYVVDQFTTSDGNSGTYQMQFQYYSARISQQGRGFKGFAAKRVRDDRSHLYAYDEFRQDFPYIGAVFAQSLFQQDMLTPIHWKVHTFNSTTLDATPTNERRFPHVTQTVDRLYEFGGAFNGQQILTRTATNQYDLQGTLLDQTTTTTEIATGLNAGAVHTEHVQQSSVLNDTSTNWCIGKPQTVQVTRSHSLPGGSAVTRTTEYDWDQTSCRLTGQVVEPTSSQWRVETQFGVDSVGNVNSIVVTPATGQGQTARTTGITWNSDGFPVTTTNAKGQVTQTGWDTLRGARSSVTDVNNLTTSWTYDSFGNLLQETRPDGTRSEYQAGWCNSGNSYCGTPGLRYKLDQTERDATSAVVRVDTDYFDALDRVRRESRQILSGAVSSVVTSYDSSGRVSARSTAFLSGDPVWYTNYAYDALGRVLQVQRQANESDTSQATTLYSYEGLRTSVTDPFSRTSATIRDAIGEVIQSLDAAGSDTDYEYDAFGNLTRTRDFYGNESTVGYNIRGMKTSSNDVDMGAWTYNYFPLGELRSQTTARNQTTTFTYDALSRPLTRVEPEGTTTWTWDTAAHGVGQLTSVTSPGAYSETYAYDMLSRPTQVSYVADGSTYLVDTTYAASTGLRDTLTYPTSTSSTRVKLRYNYQYGLLQNVRDYTGNVLGTVYWQGNATNAQSQLIDEQLGNGLQTISSYDRITGLIESRTSGTGGGSNRQNAEYFWDKVGNLTQRHDLNLNLIESFYYDNLDRLDYSQLNGATNLDVAYDAIGNITSKTGVGTYTYHATKKHAVASAGSNTYTYDANGNMLTRNGASVAWTSYNLPSVINQAGGNYSQFSYGANRSRYKQVSYSSTEGTETTIYIGGVFERVTRAGVTEHKHYVLTPSGAVAVINRKSSGVNEVSYLLRDHQGSTEMITNAAGAQIARLSNDAFGQRRNGSTWSGVPSGADRTAIYNTTHDGYTGQEQLDNLNLVHMNGRVYDPALGRFMSADPIVQAPLYSQSLNRYSYVLNSPLTRVDPSGYCSGSVADVSADTMPCFDFGPRFGSPANDIEHFFERHRQEIIAFYVRAVREAFARIGGSQGPNVLTPSVPPDGDVPSSGTPSTPPPGGSTPTTGGPPTPIEPPPVTLPGPAEGVAGLGGGGGVSAVGGLGQGFLNAVPGAYYAGQSQAAWVEGRYLLSAGLYAAALGDAALGVVTLGESTAATNLIRAGSVALDTNALIAAVERGRGAEILGGRIPVVPITAVKEFLRGGGSVEALRTFLIGNGGRVAAAGSEAAVSALQVQAQGLGRVLTTPDGRVAASAMAEGVPLITNDSRLTRFLRAIGFPVEGFR